MRRALIVVLCAVALLAGCGTEDVKYIDEDTGSCVNRERQWMIWQFNTDTYVRPAEYCDPDLHG